jgi:DNA-binding MarR family transcriptional regulator
MERVAQRDLEILSAVASGEPVTQRNLAQRLGIALGLANLYLKRLTRKGYIKVTTIPPNRLRYLLTPKGIAEKTRLTYEYIEYSLKLYRSARHVLRDTLLPLVQQGKRRGAIYGTSEAAELAFLTLKEMGVWVSLVVAEDGREGTFFGAPIRPLAELAHDDVDLIVVASFSDSDGAVGALAARGVPREKIFTLR